MARVRERIRGRIGIAAIRKRSGFLSFDALFSLIPLVMMLSFVMMLVSGISKESLLGMQNQQLFDKLVGIADYSVKAGLAMRSSNDFRGVYESASAQGDFIIHNFVNESMLTDSYVEDLRSASGLKSLEISLDAPIGVTSDSLCIYRLIVIGDDRRISRLFVCGS